MLSLVMYEPEVTYASYLHNVNLLEKFKLLHRAYKYRYIDDKDEISYLLHHIKKGDVVFDIGAHKGGYTYWMQKAVGDGGKVIAFEPQEKGAELLQQLFPQVQVERKAVTSRSGDTTLYINPQVYDVSFEAAVTDQYQNSKQEIVVATTIDDYCVPERLRPTFIKIDVEGHELEVLKGARLTLSYTRPYLLLEAETRHVGEKGLEDLFAFLKTLNYTGSFFFNGSELPVENFRASVHQHPEQISNRKLYANNFMFKPSNLTAPTAS